jgi:hypothetical protein
VFHTGSGGRRAAVAAVAAAAGALALAPAAFAETRFASPTGGTTGNCTSGEPACEINYAVETVAQANDEVVLARGTYNLSDSLEITDPIDVHGPSVDPKPTVNSTASGPAVSLTHSGAKLRRVRIDKSGSFQALFLSNGLVERVFAHSGSTAGSACTTHNGTIRDSICWAEGDSQEALGVNVSGGSGTVTARNVTAVASGTNNADGIRLAVNGGGNYSIDAKSVIAMATGTGSGSEDVSVTASDPGPSTASVTFTNSNYDEVFEFASGGDGNTASVTLAGSGTNQTSPPQFVNAAGGDFHQASASPTINAGATDASSGTSDLDGDPRLEGSAPDIGADELAPPTFYVNSVDDDADTATNGSCDTGAVVNGAPECTLRAAIQESNGNGGAVDRIKFDMESLPANPTITVSNATAFPVITTALDINGCSENQNSSDPCVGLRSDASSTPTATGLNFNTGADDGSTVRGLAFTNWSVALRYASLDPTTGPVTVQNNWFGTKLDGISNEANEFGIALQGDNALIGGDENESGARERNVFSNNSGTAIQISAGDGNKVQGNYFGTTPAGTAAPSGTGATGNGENIEVVQALTPTPQNSPDNTLIGGAVSMVQAGTTECDGVCNVIADATSSGQVRIIDLAGEGPSEASAGSTTIAGNFIGMDKTGTTALAVTNETGILVGNATGVTIGGATAQHRNYITGGAAAIAGSGGHGDLAIQNNFIGLNSAGTAALSPSSGIPVLLSDQPSISTSFTDNRVARGTDSEEGLQVSFGDLAISGNFFGVGIGGQNVGGGNMAIRVVGLDGATISSNVIGNVDAGAGLKLGMSLEDVDNTTVQANKIGTDGTNAQPVNGPGIRLWEFFNDPSTGNTIGGNTAAEENVISNASGNAIEILEDAGEGNDGNRVLRNRGSNNSGLFIDLQPPLGAGNDPNGPNGGIDEPTITGADIQTISGAAEPNAEVRVFKTAAAAGANPGDIQSFVGKVTANGSGNWTLTCPSTDCEAAPSAGDRVAASQATASTNNSSELTAAVAVTDIDADGDGILNGSDNCPGVANPSQANNDGDGQGDACDSDDDNDAVADASDNCQFVSNANQANTDGDGQGEACDFDDDNDGFGDSSDNCPSAAGTVGGCPDDDGDGVPNGSDNCPNAANAGQADFDGDGLGDACDPQLVVGDLDPPETTITKEPRNRSRDRTPTYKFKSDEAGSEFECKLDRKSWKPCDSPKTFKTKPGQHGFKVRAIDTAGNVDPKPDSDRFKVLAPK